MAAEQGKEKSLLPLFRPGTMARFVTGETVRCGSVRSSTDCLAVESEVQNHERLRPSSSPGSFQKGYAAYSLPTKNAIISPLVD
jgi:hypothetical protein